MQIQSIRVVLMETNAFLKPHDFHVGTEGKIKCKRQTTLTSGNKICILILVNKAIFQKGNCSPYGSGSAVTVDVGLLI